jgi:hypothetical protein
VNDQRHLDDAEDERQEDDQDEYEVDDRRPALTG